MRILSALIIITQSPVSTWGEKRGLFFPRIRYATRDASLPRTLSFASMTYQFSLLSDLLALYVYFFNFSTLLFINTIKDNYIFFRILSSKFKSSICFLSLNTWGSKGFESLSVESLLVVLQVTSAFKTPPFSTMRSLHSTFPSHVPVGRIISSFEAVTSPLNFPPIVILDTFVELEFTCPSSAIITTSPSMVPVTCPLIINFPLLDIEPSIFNSLSMIERFLLFFIPTLNLLNCLWLDINKNFSDFFSVQRCYHMVNFTLILLRVTF